MAKPMLTDAERAKFAAWLHAEAEEDAQLYEQAVNTSFPEPVLKQLKTRALAKKLVAEDIQGWEQQVVSRPKPVEKEHASDGITAPPRDPDTE